MKAYWLPTLLFCVLLWGRAGAQACPFAECEFSPFLRSVYAYNTSHPAAWENRARSEMASAVALWEQSGNIALQKDLLVAAELAWRYIIPTASQSVCTASSDSVTLQLSIVWTIAALVIALVAGQAISLCVLLCLLRPSKEKEPGADGGGGGRKKSAKKQ